MSFYYYYYYVFTIITKGMSTVAMIFSLERKYCAIELEKKGLPADRRSATHSILC